MNKAVTGRVDWTKAEIDRLIEIYPYLKNEVIAIVMKRGINSIQHKANRLKLSKDKEISRFIRSECELGEKNSSWKGGRKISPQGYVLIMKKGYESSDCMGYIFEHRYIAEQVMGRYLNKNEVVHHINGDKKDNKIENLKVMTNGEHTILHHAGAKRSEEVRKNISNGAKNRRKKVVLI